MKGERQKGSKEQEERDAKAQKAVAAVQHAAHGALRKVLPYTAQLLASTAAYGLGVTATQLFGYALRISCATPVLGPCFGMLGVGFASALAGRAAAQTQQLFEAGCDVRRVKWWAPVQADEALLDSFMGVLFFRAMGGRFRSLMPSSLVAPGALAFESLPARGDGYARPLMKRELSRIFRRDGCHHCGSRRGPVIGDHMPPNKLVLRGDGQLAAWINGLPIVRQVRALTGAKVPRVRQRFYPQCQRCSIKQATALRNGVRVLVVHLSAPRYRAEHLTGVFVGMRHSVPALAPPPGNGGGGGARGSKSEAAAARGPRIVNILPFTALAEAPASAAAAAGGALEAAGPPASVGAEEMGGWCRPGLEAAAAAASAGDAPMPHADSASAAPARAASRRSSLGAAAVPATPVVVGTASRAGSGGGGGGGGRGGGFSGVRVLPVRESVEEGDVVVMTAAGDADEGGDPWGADPSPRRRAGPAADQRRAAAPPPELLTASFQQWVQRGHEGGGGGAYGADSFGGGRAAGPLALQQRARGSDDAHALADAGPGAGESSYSLRGRRAAAAGQELKARAASAAFERFQQSLHY
ncbi:hypothetical protein Rsub_01109 [Raphidocelis subcapitata]|uniref:Uncharacterized protein n=1 Tax=Raphidocelis subcapitata TaxID=307507 RepID=A0A2V0NTZ9_9CHLO|nr:hypothetical protein Rsub_01109 [Raphidocelis subcapitata]|eukprot:GBF88397.1 hypothetical protein Rsub_01109 [Raphidocelis subcapitata]